MKKIKIMKDGPYKVSADIPLKKETITPGPDGISREYTENKTYPAQTTEYRLCRCGKSKKKPFCDGAHVAAGFDGTETSDNKPFDEAAGVLKGKGADLLDNEDLCAVGRFCDRGPGVWALVQDFSDDERKLAMAVDMACKCPAGRLVVRDKSGKKIEPELPQEIAALQDPVKGHRGPLFVKGGIEIEGADGVKYEKRNRVTLCRCGESGNMPFCDASHIVCKHMEGEDE